MSGSTHRSWLPWVVSPALAIVLLAVAIWGYGEYTRHQPTTYAKGGNFLAGGQPSDPHTGGHPGSKPTPTTAPSTATTATATTSTPAHQHHGGRGGNGASHGSEPATTSADSTPSVQPTRAKSAHAVAPTTAASTPTSVTGSSPSTAPALAPATGVYTLAVSGSEAPKFGPISPCDNTFPSRATLDVHHATGEPASSYDFDLRLYPGQPDKHDERHIYNYSPNGVTLTYEEETVTCSGIKQSTTVDYSPAQIRVEYPLAVGNSWHNHGGGTSRTETGTSTVTGKSTITIEGTAYQVYEIKTHLTMTGSESGIRNQVWWWSPQLAMPVKWTENIVAKRSGANYTENLTAQIVGMPN